MKRSPRPHPVVIGIAGGSGSGKSTLIARLADRFGSGRASSLELDSYYRDQGSLNPEQRAGLNYDHPDQLDWPLFKGHLQTLRAGKPVNVPQYDFATHTRSRSTRRLNPASVVIVDGILLFHDPAIRDLLDLRVYLDVEADIRLIRRLQRDIEERGRTVDSVLDQYLRSVRPMHRRFVEPTKAFAHLVLGPDISIDEAAERVSHALETLWDL
jgi:uridine kinase